MNRQLRPHAKPLFSRTLRLRTARPVLHDLRSFLHTFRIDGVAVDFPCAQWEHAEGSATMNNNTEAKMGARTAENANVEKCRGQRALSAVAACKSIDLAIHLGRPAIGPGQVSSQRGPPGVYLQLASMVRRARWPAASSAFVFVLVERAPATNPLRE